MTGQKTLVLSTRHQDTCEHYTLKKAIIRIAAGFRYCNVPGSFLTYLPVSCTTWIIVSRILTWTGYECAARVVSSWRKRSAYHRLSWCQKIPCCCLQTSHARYIIFALSVDENGFWKQKCDWLPFRHSEFGYNLSRLLASSVVLCFFATARHCLVWRIKARRTQLKFENNCTWKFWIVRDQLKHRICLVDVSHFFHIATHST